MAAGRQARGQDPRDDELLGGLHAWPKMEERAPYAWLAVDAWGSNLLLPPPPQRWQPVTYDAVRTGTLTGTGLTY